MSDKSDEDLVGDVDPSDFEFDLSEMEGPQDAKTVKKQVLDGKQLKQDSSAKKSKSNCAARVKQPLKRKFDVCPMGDDLLQAFALGTESISIIKKTNEMSSNKKRRQEPASSRKAISGNPSEQRGENKLKNDSINIKEEIKIQSINKSHKVSSVSKITKGTNEDMYDVGKDKSSLPDSKGEEVIKKEVLKSEIKQSAGTETQPKEIIRNIPDDKDKIDKKEDSKVIVNPDKFVKSEIDRHTIQSLSENTKVHPSKEKKHLKNQSPTADRSSRRSTDKSMDIGSLQKQKDVKVSAHSPEAKTNIPSVTEVVASYKLTEEDYKNIGVSLADKIIQSKMDNKQRTIETQSQKMKTDPSKDEKKKDESQRSDIISDRTSTHWSTSLLKQKDDLNDSAHSSDSKISNLSKTEVSGSSVEMKEAEKDYEFSEEDYKNMDMCLADQMLDRIRKRASSSPDVKYTVKVSPLEISDLAQPSIQQLIQLHPTTVLVFKRPTAKFRKKKGFAEATFSTMTELKEFVYQLTQIKVFEKKIDVQIASLLSMKKSTILSFVIHLNRNGKLMKLINSGEDPMIHKPIPTGESAPKIQFEKVLSTCNGAFMHSMFPFTNNVLITRSRVGSDVDPIYHGPLSVYYINLRWLEAVMECCTDFTVNDHPLSIIASSMPGHLLNQKIGSDGKLEKSVLSSEAEQKQSDHKSFEHCSYVEKKNDDEDDDPVSNMTRDVCADMLESIKKLKELESDNPNMKRILEMQEQLSELQKSLRKPHEKTGHEEKDKAHDNDSSLSPSLKKRKEVQDLEEVFEENERVEREKEEQMRCEREMETQKQKELNMKRQSQWARKIILDYKQEGVKSEGVSQEAERMLKQREERMKLRDEEGRRKEKECLKAEEFRKEKEENFKLQQQKKEEEERKEAERNRLIQKIEETRLRDSQKIDRFSASQLVWNPSDSSSNKESSTSRYGSEAKGDWETNLQYNREDIRSREETNNTASRGVDDEMDERLANFERELAQQGKIEVRTSSLSNISEQHHPSCRDEARDFTVFKEEEYQKLWAQNQLHILPPNYRVRMSTSYNRLCPVTSCPAKTCFRDSATFLEHWSIFHEAQTTMRFCPKCSAYFMTLEELEIHMIKHHKLSSLEATHLARNARVKVIPNPSFRDPTPFLPPLS